MVWLLLILSCTEGYVTSRFLTKFSMGLAYRLKILDFPGELKIHSFPIPRFGGLGIVLGTLCGGLVAVLVGSIPIQPLIPLLVGSVIIALVGGIDDIYGLSPILKLLGQIMAAITFLTILLWQGAWSVNSITIIGVPVILVYFANGFNLLDGMDGLAAGIGLVAALSLTMLALITSNMIVGIIVAGLAGALLGFVPYNVFPAKTFMGDIGSLFLGFVLGGAVLLMLFASYVTLSNVLGLLLTLVIPAVDTGLAILRRLFERKRVFSGDRRHLYDCLAIQLKKETRKTVTVMWAFSILSSGLAIVAYLSHMVIATVITVTTVAGLLSFGYILGSVPRISGSKRISQDN